MPLIVDTQQFITYQSVYGDICLALAQQLAEGLPNINVTIRQDLILLGQEQVPLIIVSPSFEREKVGDETFGGTVMYNYPIRVGFFTGDNNMVSKNVAKYLYDFEQIKGLIYQVKLPNVASQFDTFLDPDAMETSKVQAVVGDSHRVAVWVPRYVTAQTRRDA